MLGRAMPATGTDSRRSMAGRGVVGASRWLAVLAGTAAPAVHASIFAGETLDKVADIVALVVLVVVPVVLIAGFWFVHVLPEKIAEQRHHPQKDAIKTLCLLSLVFGGLLWPFAWILAYSKPVFYKMAYGTDRHEDYYKELAEKDAADATLLSTDVTQLRAELDTLAAQGSIPVELQELRERLRALEARIVAPRVGDGDA